MIEHASYEDDVRRVLRELLERTEAISVSIALDDQRAPAVHVRLGEERYLRIELGARAASEPLIEDAIAVALKKLATTERARQRHHELAGLPVDEARLPEMVINAASVPVAIKATERIEGFLRALAQVDRGTNAFVVKAANGGAAAKLIAAASPPDEQETSRWQFLARRVLSTHAPNSSHGEVVDTDAYGMSFWYDCALLVFLVEPYGVDFVRHRCKQVARELANLLPLLEPDPEAPAAIRRRPPTVP